MSVGARAGAERRRVDELYRFRRVTSQRQIVYRLSLKSSWEQRGVEQCTYVFAPLRRVVLDDNNASVEQYKTRNEPLLEQVDQLWFFVARSID